MSAFDRLHPAVQYHVVNSLGWANLRPTQLEAIEPIETGWHCLLLAPTAGGKTEAAIIPVLSRMVSEDWVGASVLYVCPIKALLNNLEQRLTRYAGLLGRTVEVWHGDVAASRKKRALRDPPDILLTTPESLEGMLVSPRIERKAWFGNLYVVIADELHAFAADDRGWHLRSVLARIDAYCTKPVQRIGLSATVSNPAQLLEWFAPRGDRLVVGSSAISTDADVTIDAVGTLENAATIVSRLHRGEKRLVFCDSRSAAEQMGAGLNQRGVRTFVSHASLSVSERRQAEAAFAEERDCAIVATSTLELGIDVGDLDRVIQIDAPATVGSFLQRMGRSGRRSGSKRNLLFLATSDSALLNSLGICRLWCDGWVEAALPPSQPWNVVVQQAILATLEAGQTTEGNLLDTLRRCFPELAVGELNGSMRHLTDTGYLARTEYGVLQVGPEAEREWGGGNYRDLMPIFTGANLLTAKHGAAEIGLLDPAVLAGQKTGTVSVLLAGKSWDVLKIDWRRRLVWLEPGQGGGKARWMGSGRGMSAELAASIRKVLRTGDVGCATLSRRASEVLERLRDEIPVGSDSLPVQQVGVDRYRVWTYSGSTVNRTLLMSGRNEGAVRCDGLSIDFSSDPRGASIGRGEPELSVQVCRDLIKSVKFADLLSDGQAILLAKTRFLTEVVSLKI